MSPAPPINIRPEKDHLPYFEEIEQFSSHKIENREPVRKFNQETDEIAPKQTRAAAAKTKERQSAETPLMRRLRNIKNAKVQETSLVKTWAEIKEWAYVDKN